MNLEAELERTLGFTTFRTGQKEIIHDVLNGKNVLAVLPTGTGKTLCYQFPSRYIEGLTIVVSPLISLMEDQVHQLRSFGEKGAVAINSHVNRLEKERIVNQLNGQSLLYVSPEMLQSDWLINQLKRQKVGLMVVDEAHCISQWGHEFRTDYLKLASIRQELGLPPCLALTATATPAVQEDIKAHLALTNVAEHIYSVDRTNISLHVKKAATYDQKVAVIKEALLQFQKPGIVYSATRAECQWLSQKMSKETNAKTAAYHGGMENGDRLLVQQQFIRDEIDVVFCTNAFGMGINKPNIQFVIHAHLPQSVEHYVQETGRAGRGGQQSAALLVYTEDDRFLPLSFIDYEIPSNEELRSLFYLIESKKSAGQQEGSFLECIRSLAFEETKERLLAYHFERLGVLKGDCLDLLQCKKEWEEDLMHLFKSRKRKKRDQLDSVEEIFGQADGCIRKQILAYFGEEQHQVVRPCCSSCDDKPVFERSFKEEREKTNTLTKRSWEMMLRDVFHQEQEEAD
ncbi:RecQ family ATP-dependent DNA helicase [Alteribacter aurantiacus]|uniref:RecQ family ATP-dependent DNA helicase n=1 Tax=Alteribacter aurantiacus TaxID=254410 RepID=UPI00041521C7|nr:ATP-dependent DNA helicase RecQ [Alteribacter aurantiacus]